MMQVRSGIGFEVAGESVSPDAATYMMRGHPFSPSQNFVMGRVVAETIHEDTYRTGKLAHDMTPALTLTDVSVRLASSIDTVMQKINSQNALIEVGGCPDDPEAQAIPGAIRLLDQKYGAGITLLTTFGSVQQGKHHAVRTRGATRAVEETMKAYWGLPLRRVFIRRIGVSDTINDEILKDAGLKVAYNTQQHPEKVIFLPNVTRPEELDVYTAPSTQKV